MKQIPRVLCIGGHDPTGGAGIQADIETVAALGGQALTLVSALTTQDTADVYALRPTAPAAFAEQAATLLRDLPPDAVKIGLIGAPALVPVIVRLLDGFAGPLVLDPVLAAGGGRDLAAAGLIEQIREHLLPRTSLITPNRAEARRLTGLDDAAQAARALLAAGAGAVLLTGADEADGDRVSNRLFSSAGDTEFTWPRLPARFHGSGCTLAAACATRLAFGDDLVAAVGGAQDFTQRALQHALPGAAGGQWLPWRRA